LELAMTDLELEMRAEPPPPPVTDNVFVPENRDLTECITAVPKPGCGSEARSDWHQGLVLGVMVAGLIVIGWRIGRAVRRGEAKHNDVDLNST
jgi:hypothetical protein